MDQAHHGIEATLHQLRSLVRNRTGTRSWVRDLLVELREAGDLHHHTGEIARRLNGLGIKARGGSLWQRTQVDRLLMIGTLQSAPDDRVERLRRAIAELQIIDAAAASHYQAESVAVLKALDDGGREARKLEAELRTIMAERKAVDPWHPRIRDEDREAMALEGLVKDAHRDHHDHDHRQPERSASLGC